MIDIWRCEMCGQEATDQYKKAAADPYRCTACLQTHLDWTLRQEPDEFKVVRGGRVEVRTPEGDLLLVHSIAFPNNVILKSGDTLTVNWEGY